MSHANTVNGLKPLKGKIGGMIVEQTAKHLATKFAKDGVVIFNDTGTYVALGMSSSGGRSVADILINEGVSAKGSSAIHLAMASKPEFLVLKRTDGTTVEQMMLLRCGSDVAEKIAETKAKNAVELTQNVRDKITSDVKEAVRFHVEHGIFYSSHMMGEVNGLFYRLQQSSEQVLQVLSAFRGIPEGPIAELFHSAIAQRSPNKLRNTQFIFDEPTKLLADAVIEALELYDKRLRLALQMARQ